MFPVALGLLALASCSNDDFFGSNDQKETLQLIATVEAPNNEGDITRAAYIPQTMKPIWQKNDQFRVYDEALQKYDVFKCNGSEIKLDGTSHVESHVYAIFPGDKVYYAGFDKKNNIVTAVMEIPSSITYGGQAKEGDAVGFVSALPMWGDVKDPAATNLEVELKNLGGYTDITLYKGMNVSKVRVVAAKSGVTTAEILAKEVGAMVAGTDVDAATPLAGYFDAQLKENGTLVKSGAPLNNFDKSYIEVSGIPTNVDSVHVYIPIVPATYANLMIQYYDGAWKELKTYPANTVVSRNTPVRKGLQVGSAPISARVSSLEDLNTKLGIIAANYAGKSVNIELDDEVATTEALQELTIPAITADQVITIKGTIKNSTPNLPLTIKGGAASKTLQLNVNIEGTENIVVDPAYAGTLILTGNYTSTGTGVNHTTFAVSTTTGNIKFGNGQYDAFTTNLNVAAAGAVTVNAGEGKLAGLTVAGGVTVESGEIASITKSAATGDIELKGGKVGTIGIADALATATFNTTVKDGATATTLNLAKTSGMVTINKGAKVTTATTGTGDVKVQANVTTVTTAATTVEVSSNGADVTVGTLTLNNTSATALSIKGNGKKLAKVTNLVVGASATAQTTVTSEGKAAIVNVTDGTTAATKFDFTTNASKLLNKATDDKVTDINAAGEIYTAAQLAGISTGKNYTLMVDVNMNGKAWTSLNLNGNFTAAGKTITGLNAPLFNKISGGVIGGSYSNGAVTPLTLTNVAIAQKAGNLGALAKEVDGTATLQNIYVNGSVASTNEADQTNIGGLVGTAKGNVTLLNVVIGSSSAVNIKGYKNVGGYIGSFGAGTLNIQISKILGPKSRIALAYLGHSAKPAAADAGTFGNFIGSVTGAANISVSNLTTTEATTIDSYFTTKTITDATSRNNVFYNENKNASDKAFIGMQGAVTEINGLTLTYEIGRSTGSISNLTLYNKTKDELGNPFTLTIDHINQYAE